MKNRKDKNNNLFIIILFFVIFVLVLFLPKIYSFIEKQQLPKVESIEEKKEEEKKLDEDVLETIHYPIMRNSIYDSNTYYILDRFTISDMSNNDILYNAFLDIYEGNITPSNTLGKCTNTPREINKEYLELRIKNILGKNINYTLDTFYVPEDTESSYKGTWNYDSSNSRFIYNGLCQTKVTNTKYYNLEQLIKTDFQDNDIVVYYYVGFAKVVDNSYVIYKDANMTNELSSGSFTTVEELSKMFESMNNKKKNIYRYTFKNTLCSYGEYCLYEGKWVNEI